jgi:hypothetical protein
MSKLVRIALGMLVRQEKRVIVKVPDDFDTWDDDKKRDFMINVYDADDGSDFTDANEFGCEEANHHFLGYAPGGKPDFIADEDGKMVEED